jgi:Ca2+-binding EF-hand superfamily protein
MTATRRFLLATATLAAVAAFTAPTQAQDVKREEMVSYFQMPMMDKNKDSMVSKKEFMDMMAKSWDMHMAAMPKADVKARDKMTLQQYQDFAKMFGLNVGG